MMSRRSWKETSEEVSFAKTGSRVTLVESRLWTPDRVEDRVHGFTS
jgi:hypothetical protein